MRTLLQALRLLRLPMAFTAVGDAWAVRMLGRDAGGWSLPPAGELATLAGISVGLFGLGMALNDVVDAKADAAGQPDRPIPSGAVRRPAAAVLAVALGAAALALARLYGPETLLVAAAAAVLIVGYDLGLKRVPVIGLILLGLIRAVHCQISAEPTELGGWLSLFLFSHVAIVSWIGFEWEGKRPAVSAVGRWVLAFVIVLMNVALVGYLTESGSPPPLTLPLLAALAFLLVLVWVLGSRRFETAAERGRMAIRLGLIWLLVYDAAFLALAGRWAGAIAMAVLLGLLAATSRLMAWTARRARVIGTSPPRA